MIMVDYRTKTDTDLIDVAVEACRLLSCSTLERSKVSQLSRLQQ